MSTSKADVVQHAETGAWRSLVEVALKIVTDAERAAGVSMHPLLGGGTRLMLSLHHRISDDIDLFIRDPQWIGYLTPRLNPKIDELTSSYEGIELALQAMRESQAAQRIWSSLRAPDKPSLSEAVDFGLEEIAAFRSIDAS